MRKFVFGFIGAVFTFVVVAAVMPGRGALAAENAGEALFKQHCAVCHPDGGNIMNPQKTLHKKDREANNVKTAGDIVKLMRNPGPGMQKFDTATISDAQAHEIAEYVLRSLAK